jgi:TonB family protein
VESQGSRVVVLIALVAVFATFAFGQINKSYDTPVKIIDKPRAFWTDEALRSAQLQGNVTLRVQFLENGKIGKVFVVSGLPHGLNESSVEAAKKIKFKPATKDRRPVKVFKQVQYTFTLY